jgi:predicted outer membrane repeat protein
MYNNSVVSNLCPTLRIGLCVLTLLFAASEARSATYTVTNTADSGPGSLRTAITQANATSDNDTIEFDLSGCPCTIILTSGVLAIVNNGTLTINGPGADQLSVSGNNLSRVFFNGTLSNATIRGITITGGNTSSIGGGGILNSNGTLTLTNSTVNNNSAIGSPGGGIFNSGTVTVTNSTVSNNFAGSGGGIFSQSGTVTLVNSTVSNNSATNGGGIATNGTMMVTNSTVSNNSAAFGGGIYYNSFGTTNLSNTIIANSTSGGDCVRNVGTINAEYSLIGDGLGCVNGTNNNNLNGDPMLGPLQDNGGPTFTHALLAGSPAIDAGSNTLAAGLTTDQRGTGFDRIVGSAVDIGAFEWVATVTENCPLPQGYWKRNPDWPETSLTLGNETYEQSDLMALLNTPTGAGRNADASLILARQLIAAKLNVANGSDPTTVSAAITAADYLLAELDGKLPYGVRPSTALGRQMTAIAETLDQYNNGLLTSGCAP